MLRNQRGKLAGLGTGAKDNNVKNLASYFHAQPTQIPVRRARGLYVVGEPGIQNLDTQLLVNSMSFCPFL